MKQIGELSLRKLSLEAKIWVMLIIIATISLVVFLDMRYVYSRTFLAALELAGWVALVTIPHEALHGLFFWLFSGKVQFGVIWKTSLGPCPYATAKGCLLTRNHMEIIAAAPQLLTLALLAIAFLIPTQATALRIIALTNLAGGAMDLYDCMWLSRFNKEVLVEDRIVDTVVYSEEE